MVHKSLALVIALGFVLISMIEAQAEDPYFIESGGVVSMEAEHYSRNNGYVITSNPTIRTHWPRNLDASGFSGTGYVATNYTGVRIDYDILFTNTGTYTVNLRSIADYDNYGGGEQNGFCAQFNGAPLVCAQRGCGMNVAKWAGWAWVTRQQWPVEPLLRGTVTFHVSAPGKYTFSILPREHESWFDKIVLQRTVSCGNSDYQGCLSGTGPPESERSTDKRTPPEATTGTATASSDSATLNGTVNPNGASTTVVFEYGQTTSYGNTVEAAQNPLSGSTAQPVSADISGLEGGKTYHFRAKATNSNGTDTGEDKTFDTPIPDEIIIDNETFENGTVSSYTANVSITLGPGVTIESGATVTLTAPLVKGVDDVTVYEGANLTIKTQ